MALCLELAYPITNSSSSSSRDSAPFRHRLPLNSFIDSILRTVYHASAPPPEGHGVRRQIIFTSSSPDACAAVNWKQPNCQSLFLPFTLPQSPTLLCFIFWFCVRCPVFFFFSSWHLIASFFLDPVLFASSCGEVGASPPSTTTTTPRNEAAHDLRLSSISAAVEFSKNNNLLGVFLDTYLLV